MAAKCLICVLLMIAGLAGCATSLAPERVSCNGGRCNVDIHVDNCTISAPDIDNFGANNIFWNIDAASKRAGYTFPDDAVHPGVSLKNPPPSGCANPEGVFDSPEQLNKWKFKWHNKGTRGTYCYGVRVVNGATTCTLDPFVVNH